MNISPEKFKNFGPVAWLLVIAGVLSSITGIYALGVDAYHKWYLRTDISGELCNAGRFCAQSNGDFHSSLLRHVADSRRVTIDITYEVNSGGLVGDDGSEISCDAQGNYFWNFPDESQEPEVIPLPMEAGDCRFEVIFPPGTFKLVNTAMATAWYRATGDFYVGASGLGRWLTLTSAE